MREVIVSGIPIFAWLPTLAGLVVWLGIALTLAIRGFRWKEVPAEPAAGPGPGDLQAAGACVA